MNRLNDIFKREVTIKQDLHGRDYLSLSTGSVAAMARDSGLSPREVEIEALQWGAIPERYQRNMGTLGIDGQLKLLNSSVAVVGAGGLGGSVIELLARVGVGRLKVIDHDVFSEEIELFRQGRAQG